MNPSDLPELEVERILEAGAGEDVPAPPLNVVLLADDIEQKIRAHTAPTFYNFNPMIAEPDI